MKMLFRLSLIDSKRDGRLSDSFGKCIETVHCFADRFRAERLSNYVSIQYSQYLHLHETHFMAKCHVGVSTNHIPLSQLIVNSFTICLLRRQDILQLCYKIENL